MARVQPQSGLAPIHEALIYYEMDRTALANEVKGPGKRLPDSKVPVVQRLDSQSRAA